MASSTQDNPIEVKPDEMVGYTKDEQPKEEENKVRNNDPVYLTQIPQGQGSGLDSDKVDGIHAVTSQSAGPNVLVATDSTGKLPAAVLPSLGSWALISKQTVTAATSLSLGTNLDSTAKYWIVGNYTQNTSAGFLGVRFNSDATAAHYFNIGYVMTWGSGAGGATNNANAGILTTRDTLSAGNSSAFSLFVMPDQTTAANMVAHGTYWAYYSNAQPGTAAFMGGVWKGTSAMGSISLVPTAGTITGTFSLYQEGLTAVTGEAGPQGATGATGAPGPAGTPGTFAPTYSYWKDFQGF